MCKGGQDGGGGGARVERGTGGAVGSKSGLKGVMGQAWGKVEGKRGGGGGTPAYKGWDTGGGCGGGGVVVAVKCPPT